MASQGWRAGTNVERCRRFHVWAFRVISGLLLLEGLCTVILGPAVLFRIGGGEEEEGGGWFKATIVVFGAFVVAVAAFGLAGSVGHAKALVIHIFLLVPVVAAQSIFTIILTSDNVTILSSIEAKYGESPLLHQIVESFRANMTAFKAVSASILIVEAFEIALGIHLLRQRMGGSGLSPFLPRFLQRRTIDWRALDLGEEEEREATLVGFTSEAERQRTVYANMRAKYFRASAEEEADEGERRL